MSFKSRSFKAGIAICSIAIITGFVRLYPALTERSDSVAPGSTNRGNVVQEFPANFTDLASASDVDPATSKKHRPQAPSMLSAPVVFSGPYAGKYPNAEWINRTNRGLALLGFAPIQSCDERTSGLAYAYMPDCRGTMRFVNDMYTAAAIVSGLTAITDEQSETPSARVPDIVDSTVPLRLQTYGALFNGGPPNSNRIENASAAVAYSDALASSVPFTASRAHAPQLLPEAVNEPLPEAAKRGKLSSAAMVRSTGKAPVPTAPTFEPKVVQIDGPETVDRPSIADYVRPTN